jgi:hypothetical protein
MTCEVGLSSVVDPLSSTGHILRVRIRKTNTSGNSPTIALKQGSTTIATFTYQNRVLLLHILIHCLLPKQTQLQITLL